MSNNKMITHNCGDIKMIQRAWPVPLNRTIVHSPNISIRPKPVSISKLNTKQLFASINNTNYGQGNSRAPVQTMNINRKFAKSQAHQPKPSTTTHTNRGYRTHQTSTMFSKTSDCPFPFINAGSMSGKRRNKNKNYFNSQHDTRFSDFNNANKFSSFDQQSCMQSMTQTFDDQEDIKNTGRMNQRVQQCEIVHQETQKVKEYMKPKNIKHAEKTIDQIFQESRNEFHDKYLNFDEQINQSQTTTSNMITTRRSSIQPLEDYQEYFYDIQKQKLKLQTQHPRSNVTPKASSSKQQRVNQSKPNISIKSKQTSDNHDHRHQTVISEISTSKKVTPIKTKYGESRHNSMEINPQYINKRPGQMIINPNKNKNSKIFTGIQVNQNYQTCESQNHQGHKSMTQSPVSSDLDENVPIDKRPLQNRLTMGMSEYAEHFGQKDESITMMQFRRQFERNFKVYKSLFQDKVDIKTPKTRLVQRLVTELIQQASANNSETSSMQEDSLDTSTNTEEGESQQQKIENKMDTITSSQKRITFTGIIKKQVPDKLDNEMVGQSNIKFTEQIQMANMCAKIACRNRVKISPIPLQMIYNQTLDSIRDFETKINAKPMPIHIMRMRIEGENSKDDSINMKLLSKNKNIIQYAVNEMLGNDKVKDMQVLSSVNDEIIKQHGQQINHKQLKKYDKCTNYQFSESVNQKFHPTHMIGGLQHPNIQTISHREQSAKDRKEQTARIQENAEKFIRRKSKLLSKKPSIDRDFEQPSSSKKLPTGRSFKLKQQSFKQKSGSFIVNQNQIAKAMKQKYLWTSFKENEEIQFNQRLSQRESVRNAQKIATIKYIFNKEMVQEREGTLFEKIMNGNGQDYNFLDEYEVQTDEQITAKDKIILKQIENANSLFSMGSSKEANRIKQEFIQQYQNKRKSRSQYTSYNTNRNKLSITRRLVEQ